MRKLNKKGHDIDIKAIVVHRVDKEAHSNFVSIKQADKLIVHNEKEKRFISDLHKSYKERSNPIYGLFDNEHSNIENMLNDYLCAKDNFLQFSCNAVGRYKEKISESIPATGGYLIMCHYKKTDSNNEYLLILTTQNKEGFTINDKLIIESVESIDMSKVDVACLINLTRYNQIKDKEDNYDTYLSFVRGNKDISLYFMSFVGCKDRSSAKESSIRLRTAIEDYLDSKGWDSEAKTQKKVMIYEYCDRCIKDRESISLRVISELINNDDPNEFRFYASEKYNVSATISGNREVLKRLVSIFYKDRSMIISFERQLIIDNVVIYDNDSNELLIKSVPKDLAEQILKQ